MAAHYSRKRKPSSQTASPAPKRVEKLPKTDEPVRLDLGEGIEVDEEADSSLEEGEVKDDYPQEVFVVDSEPSSKQTAPIPINVDTPSPTLDSLFFVDIAPQAVKKARVWEEETPAESTVKETNGLILPDHITLESPDLTNGEEKEREQGEAAPLTEAEVFADELIKIEYLDGEDKQVTRYFDTIPEGEEFGSGGKANIVCNVCKQRGHTQRECKQEVCLTCGAVDEHTTRSCPVALTCFNCGQRGHRVKDCPVPRSQRHNRYGNGNTHCDRCGADTHLGNNCPTLWRIYSYLTTEDRDEALHERQRLKTEGGFEGDVLEADPDGELEGAGDWCYNCARDGHFGDDCPQYRSSRIPIVDYSAFSAYNASNSPFWASRSSTSTSSRPSTHTRFNAHSGSALEVPEMMENVGRRGKERERERARAYEKTRRREDEDEEEDDNWFTRSNSSQGTGLSIKGKSKERSDRKDRRSDRDYRDDRDRDYRDRDRERESGSRSGGSIRRDKDRPEKRDRKKRRKSKEGYELEDEQPASSSSRPYISGGTGTELEAEYLSEHAAGSNRTRNRGELTSSSTTTESSKRGFSFKLGGLKEPGSTTPSSIQPSILKRMGIEVSSTSRSDNSSASSSSSSTTSKRTKDKTDGGSGTGPNKADRRDAARKDKEREAGIKEMLDRFNGKGRNDYLDSPDRRGSRAGGAGTPATGRSRYNGGYR